MRLVKHTTFKLTFDQIERYRNDFPDFFKKYPIHCANNSNNKTNKFVR